MAWILLAAAAAARVDLWDLPPVNYSDTMAGDRVAVLASELAEGRRAVEGVTELEKLRFVLEVLEVPESSQVLVFSKTSKQNGLIRPGTPRALYFSEEVYVGYVPGGLIEIIAQDRVLGPVFYGVDPRGASGLRIKRDVSDCLSCHGTTRTENAPGVLVRSVFPDADGQPILSLGTTTVDDRTPVEERWGGYFVTGTSARPHLGNRVFFKGGATEPEIHALDDVAGRVELSRYPRATSDVVALVVLEHQCRVHNLLTAASMRYRRAAFLGRVTDPGADPDSGQAGRIADTMAAKIVEALLFKDEADLGEGIEGDASYQRDFVARYPRTSGGQSLADFKLYRRIFKNRCSYMVYSPAFRELPPRVGSAVNSGLERALAGDDPAGAHLAASEKKRILRILEETLPEWQGIRR